jgi:predicted 3-demethylubiquinone-9 3-methyltransferase (glyoxalase superfamily)
VCAAHLLGAHDGRHGAISNACTVLAPASSGGANMQKITPFLWFDGKAEEAANFYASVFKRSKILSTSCFGDAAVGSTGKVMSVTFELEGLQFIALNGGPHFTFTPAISLFVNCEEQNEVDELWDKLSAGGEKSRCGWLKDKYGVSWQVIPTALGQLLQDKDAEKSKRVMQAMMQMTKIDIAALKKAYDGQA